VRDQAGCNNKADSWVCRVNRIEAVHLCHACTRRCQGRQALFSSPAGLLCCLRAQRDSRPPRPNMPTGLQLVFSYGSIDDPYATSLYNMHVADKGEALSARHVQLRLWQSSASALQPSPCTMDGDAALCCGCCGCHHSTCRVLTLLIAMRSQAYASVMRSLA
jgi:hypothetical protein